MAKPSNGSKRCKMICKIIIVPAVRLAFGGSMLGLTGTVMIYRHLQCACSGSINCGDFKAVS